MARLEWLIPSVYVISAFALSGCTTTDTIGKGEPKLMTETLHSIVLLSGEEIVFNQTGGKYSLIRTIIGRTLSGLTVRLPQDEILQARSWRSPGVPLDSSRSWTIAEILLKDSTLLSFDPPGGRFDAEKNVITGRSQRYPEPVSYNPRVVLEYRELAGTLANIQLTAGDTAARFKEVLLLHPRYKAVEFDSLGGKFGEPSEYISGTSQSGTAVRVPLSSILYAKVVRTDAVRSILAVVGITAVVAGIIFLIALATKQSCPFVYSYDGKRYTFDAEPLGGATTEGLARTDYSNLEYLRPVNGTYRLLVRNEVDETQYLDAISLSVIDHDSSLTPISAGENRFHLLPRPVPPVTVRDERGADLQPFFSKDDGIAWQTAPDRLDPAAREVRQVITLRYVKPAAARRAQLIVHGGTTPWGSNTVRLLYSLLGNTVDRWYTEADRNGAVLDRLMGQLGEEELYTLRLFARKEGSWVQCGLIAGGGPFIHEVQCVPIDLQSFEGDTLTLQIRPPLGFWSFDFAGIVYDRDSLCTATEVPLLSATDQNQRDVSSTLASQDHRYLEMPTTQDEAMLIFSVPPHRAGLARSVFLKTSGFYRLHLPKDHPPEAMTIWRLNLTPGEVVRYSLEKYQEWLGSLRAQLALREGRP